MSTKRVPVYLSKDELENLLGALNYIIDNGIDVQAKDYDLKARLEAELETFE